jgi:hypothetical protein
MSDGTPSPCRVHNGQKIRHRQAAGCRHHVKQQLVLRHRVPARVIAGKVHRMLGALADELAHLVERQLAIPKPIVKIFGHREPPRLAP